ncbi:hypothetical protein FNH05_15820 [Amycolatopsis rhizosphaerae]|uniref:HEAT repeat domain-containing protein n=1 Tax=Amycolatopsis rhizosphaerae TaxID=2053003 RepID=A0A558CP78_9PSEU|nr:HEAT repeat domain-containing protein [Amycolatopsis rhizosphaerae]TVT50573.1 hypothetical protein FNH05_15820 [Amycolatopsis rhizosphaerae]
MPVGEIDQNTVWFDGHSMVYRDFDFDLDAPGDRSSAALEALEADLGVSDDVEVDFLSGGEWGQRLANVIDKGLSALLERLSHPDLAVRRIMAVVLAYADAQPDAVVPTLLQRSERDPDAPVRLGLLLASGRYANDPRVSDHLRRRMREGGPAEALGAALGLALPPFPVTDDEVVEALTLCADEQAGAALAELAWGDPRWNGEPSPRNTVDRVDGWLADTPDVRSRWLSRMLPRLWDGRLDPSAAPVLIEAADRLFEKDGCYADHAAAVADLLGHPDSEVRRAAIRTHHLYAHDGYADALLGVLDDPDLSARALISLLRRKDPRCLPHLRERMRQGTLDCRVLRYAGNFAEELWPAIGARVVDQDTPAAELAALLTQVRGWHASGDPIALPVAIALERLNARIEAAGNPESDDHAAAREAAGFLRDWRARAADEQSLEGRLARMRHILALSHPKDHDVVRSELDALTRRHEPDHTPHPDDPRRDITACEWIAALPHAAQPAVPVLRRLRDTAAVAGTVRAAAAHALWKITGNADGALPVLVEQIRQAPLLVLDYLGSMGAAARPALPALRLCDDGGDGDFALLARHAVRKIEGVSRGCP